GWGGAGEGTGGVSRDRRLVAGLDLGSTKTCAVIAEVVGDLPRSPVAKVLGVGLARNTGVRRGVVRDIDETTRSIVAAMRDAERMAGAKVSGVACGVAGEHVAARTSSGVVAVTGEGITGAAVARDERERSVALVEVGGRSTGVAICHEGKIRQLAWLKFAGTRVSSDLVQGLGVTQADAERLKERFGIAYAPLVDPSEMVPLPS